MVLVCKSNCAKVAITVKTMKNEQKSLIMIISIVIVVIQIVVVAI